MEFAVHMKNNKTGEKRIKRIKADNIDSVYCKDFYYGSAWVWMGSEPWHNVSDNVVHMGNGYYRNK